MSLINKTESVNKAIECIIANGMELDAIDILLKSLDTKYRKLHTRCHSAEGSLRAIHKINASSNGDKKNAIAALSDFEGDE